MNLGVVRLDPIMLIFFNSELSSLAVFTAAFYFSHAEENLIKHKLYNN